MQFLEINSLATNTQKVEWASQNLQLDSKKKSTPTHEEQKYTREEIQMSQGDVDMPQHRED